MANDPMSGIPDALYKWYRSSYPTLSFNPDWLAACVEYLVENEPAARASVPGLIKAVEVQLLSSDLGTSVIPSSQVDPIHQLQGDPRANKTTTTTRLFSDFDTAKKKKGGTLVQVIEVDDVAHSALSLVDTLSEKREARKVVAKAHAAGVGAGRARGGGGAEGRIMDLNDDQDDGGGDDDLEAEAKRRAHDARAGNGEPTFPRGSGRFVLTDGGPAKWTAFELERIDGLGLEQIRLGTKLLVHDVPCNNGILMLTPRNTVVKGYQVEELELVREWYLENRFRSRLGLEPLPDPRDAITPEPVPPPPPAPGARARQPPPQNAAALQQGHRPRQPKSQDPDDYFGEQDLDLDLADFELADQLAAANRAAPPRIDHGESGGGGDGMEDSDEEEALREMLRLEAAANFKPGPTPSPKKKPRLDDQPARTTAAAARSRPGPSGGPRRADGAISKSSGSGGSGVGGGGIEVLDLDDDDDDDDKADDEEVKPLRRQVKAEPVAPVRGQKGGRGGSGGGGGGGGAGKQTVIEIDDDSD
ncbi:hypothetical protein JCM3774_002767 [Rhodotorula dairenensis]